MGLRFIFRLRHGAFVAWPTETPTGTSYPVSRSIVARRYPGWIGLAR
jgi:hypothetical protein